MKKAFVYFHQGWTDIIICMGLINYYSEMYDEITILIRSDAKELIDFYVKPIDNVNVIYINTDNGRFYGNINFAPIDEVKYEGVNITIPLNFYVMTHGDHDKYRKDNYRGYWGSGSHNHKPHKHFSEAFYTFYDIDFNVRVKNFNLKRNNNLENYTYKKFIEKYGENYVVYHDDENNHKHGICHVSTKIDFNNKLEGYEYINLNKISYTFFDYIKVIEYAKEIHLIDSIWAAICYQLDVKYGLFDSKKINVYCKRGHYNLFTYPVKLPNWNLI